MVVPNDRCVDVLDALPFLQKCHLSTSRGVPAALGRDLLQRVNGLYVQSLKDTPTLEPGTVVSEIHTYFQRPIALSNAYK